MEGQHKESHRDHCFFYRAIIGMGVAISSQESKLLGLMGRSY